LLPIGSPGFDLRMAELKELRKHPRFECEGVAEIHLLGIEKSCPARIEDLSLKGCKLVLLDEPEPDFDLPTVFELTFTVNELSFRTRGRSTGFRGTRCIGVEFVDLRPRSKRFILDLVEELAAGNWKPTLHGAASIRPGAKVLIMSSEK
jgi:hypothetical protein